MKALHERSESEAAAPMKASGSSSWAVFGLFLALFSASYFPVLVADYGVTDDYYDLVTDSAIPLEYAVPDYFKTGRGIAKKITEGRPIYALAMYLAYRTAKEVGDLRYIRFAGILGISLLAWMAYWLLVRTGHDRFQSFCVGAITGSTLPFQVYAHWATAAPFPFAAALSGFAFILADRALTPPSGRLTKWFLAGGATAALVAALAIYQPAAMFYWVLAAIVLLDPNRVLRDVSRRLGWCCMIAAAALVLGYVVAVLGSTLYPYHPNRIGLVSDVPVKLAWFLFGLLPRALSFVLPSPSHLLPSDGSSIAPSYALDIADGVREWAGAAGGGSSIAPSLALLDKLAAWTFFIAISSGLVLYLRSAGGKARWKFGIAIFLLFAAYIPSLVSEGFPGLYRTLPALSSIIVLYAYLAVKGVARTFHRGRHLNVIVGAAAIACVLSAAHHVRIWLVEPQVRELEFMRGELMRGDLSQVRRIFVIRPSPGATLAPLMHQEFGAPSSQLSWSPRAMVFLILHETAPEYAHLPVTGVEFGESVTLPPGSLVVNMSNLGVVPHPLTRSAGND